MRCFCAQEVKAVNPFKITSIPEIEWYCMTNFWPYSTGLKMTIFISASLGPHKHGPHVKVPTLYCTKVPPDGELFTCGTVNICSLAITTVV